MDYHRKGKDMSDGKVEQRIIVNGEGGTEVIKFGDDYVTTQGGTVRYIGSNNGIAKSSALAIMAGLDRGALTISYDRHFTPYFKITVTRFVTPDGASWFGVHSLCGDPVSESESLVDAVAETTRSLQSDLRLIVEATEMKWGDDCWVLSPELITIDSAEPRDGRYEPILLNGHSVDWKGLNPLNTLKVLASNALAKMKETTNG